MVTTDYAWTIFFDNIFILTNVLYMPQFSFNLIFVPKLTYCLDCKLIFNNSTCLIHKSYLKKMIGEASLKRRLYILNHPQLRVFNTLSCNFDSCIKNLHLKHHTYVNSVKHHGSSNLSSCNILHLRVGYPSYEKLFEIKKSFPFV